MKNYILLAIFASLLVACSSQKPATEPQETVTIEEVDVINETTPAPVDAQATDATAPTEGPLDTMINDAETAADKAGDTVASAADKVGTTVETAADKAGSAVKAEVNDLTFTAKTVTYQCDGNQTLTVSYTSPDNAEVKMKNETIKLTSAVTASGARYTGQGYELATKNNDAMWTTPASKTAINCKAAK